MDRDAVDSHGTQQRSRRLGARAGAATCRSRASRSRAVCRSGPVRTGLFLRELPARRGRCRHRTVVSTAEPPSPQV